MGELPLKLPPRLLATVPELATELNAALSTKADGRSVILFGDEASYQTGAQRCEPSCHPPATRARARTRTHALTQIHSQTSAPTHSQGGASSLEREVLCQLVPVSGQLYVYFYAVAFAKNAEEKEKAGVHV